MMMVLVVVVVVVAVLMMRIYPQKLYCMIALSMLQVLLDLKEFCRPLKLRLFFNFYHTLYYTREARQTTGGDDSLIESILHA